MGEDNIVVAYSDDIILSGEDPIALEKAMTHLEELIYAGGHTLNRTKSTIYSPMSKPLFESDLFNTQHVQGFKLLGAYIGTDVFVKRQLANFQKEFEESTNILIDFGRNNKHCAYYLYRVCLLPKVTHLLRNINMIGDFCEKIDSLSVNFIYYLLQADFSRVNDDYVLPMHNKLSKPHKFTENPSINTLIHGCVHLLVSSGGFGLVSTELTRRSAYLASIIECQRLVNNASPTPITKFHLNNIQTVRKGMGGRSSCERASAEGIFEINPIQ